MHEASEPEEAWQSRSQTATSSPSAGFGARRVRGAELSAVEPPDYCSILRSGPFPSASSNRACRRRASSVCPRAGSVLKHFAFCPLLNRHPRTRRRVRDPRVRRGLVRKLAWNPYLRAPGPSLSTARSESDPMQLRMQLIFIADRKQPLRLAEAELFGRPDHYLVAAN